MGEGQCAGQAAERKRNGHGSCATRGQLFFAVTVRRKWLMRMEMVGMGEVRMVRCRVLLALSLMVTRLRVLGKLLVVLLLEAETVLLKLLLLLQELALQKLSLLLLLLLPEMLLLEVVHLLGVWRRHGGRARQDGVNVRWGGWRWEWREEGRVKTGGWRRSGERGVRGLRLHLQRRQRVKLLLMLVLHGVAEKRHVRPQGRCC